MHASPYRFAPLIAAGSLMLLSNTQAQAQLTATKISDSIVDSNALLFATSGATWGRAINGAAYQAEALVSLGGYQYTTWYTHDARSVMIARRTIDGGNVGAWDIVNTGFTLTNTSSDVHNTISLGLSKTDGSLHLSWDHHGHSLNYAKTAAGVATSTATWGPGMFTKSPSGYLLDKNIGGITYPMFFNTPTGDLQFAYRSGGSGNGQFKLSTYTESSWSTPRMILGSTGTYVEGTYTSTSRNAYPNGFDYGPDGTLHTSWVWREDAGGSNHDINYASSPDGGVTWKNNAGTQVADTAAGDVITITDPSIIIRPLDLKQSLYNQQSQAVDKNGGVHALMWHRRQGEPGYEWQSGDAKWEPSDSAYHHYHRDPVSGEWSSHRLPVEVEIGGVTRPLPLGRRGQIGADTNGNVFAVYTTRELTADADYVYTTGNLVIAGATAASGYTDWAILHIEDVLFDGEPLIDKDRLFSDGILSIFLQEATFSENSGETGTNLHVLEFAVPEPGSLGLLGTGSLLTLSRRRH